MKERKARDLPNQEKALENLEQKLQSIYQPTRPRQEYVSNLHYRLDQELIMQGARPDSGGLGYVVITVLSVVSGAFLFVVLLRRLLSLFGHVDQVTSQVDANAAV